MNPVFEIVPEAIFFQQTNLICEISPDGFSYFFENEVEKKIHGLSVFYFAKDADVSEQLKEIFNGQPLLGKRYKTVCVAYSGIESVLVPQELYNPETNTELLNTLYGDLQQGALKTDLSTDKKIYNVYRMPVAVHQAITDQFPQAKFYHYYSLLIKQGFAQTDLLKIIFYQDTFIVALVKNGELQIINTYFYYSGTDVAYHLLNICHQYNITNVPTQIEGIIKMDSDLHKHINHYFPELSFTELPREYEFAKTLKELPPHYFSHLYSLALCV